MQKPLGRILLTTIAVMGALSATAGTAQAALTPTNAAVSGTDGTTQWESSGIRTTCPRGDLTATISADGRKHVRKTQIRENDLLHMHRVVPGVVSETSLRRYFHIERGSRHLKSE